MGRPWSDVNCPYEGLEMFMTISTGWYGRRSSHSPGSGSVAGRNQAHVCCRLSWADVTGFPSVVCAARSMEVRHGVRGLFLILSFMHGSSDPPVRGCPDCGRFINHDDGCKHMICYGNTTLRYQGVTAMHVIEDTVRSRRIKTPKWMAKAARKKSKEVAMTFLVRG